MNFEKHIDNIDTIMRSCADKLAALDANIAATREDIDQKKRFGNVSPARLAVLNEEWEEAGDKYRADTAAAIVEAQKAAEDARKALEADAAEFAAVHPADVDAATVALLNAGIVTDTDLVRLVNENGENVTMLRLLCAQAERLMEDSTTARSLAAQIKAFVSPDARLEIFDAALANAHVGAGADLIRIAREAWDSGIYQKFRAEMQRLNHFAFETV